MHIIVCFESVIKYFLYTIFLGTNIFRKHYFQIDESLISDDILVSSPEREREEGNPIRFRLQHPDDCGDTNEFLPSEMNQHEKWTTISKTKVDYR